MGLNSLTDIEVGRQYRLFADCLGDPTTVEVCLNPNAIVEGTLQGNILDIEGMGTFSVSKLRRGEREFLQIEGTI